MPEPKVSRPAARHVAERLLERLLADALHAYGPDRDAWASSIVASFMQVRWEYHGYNRRLVLVTEWEADPEVADPGSSGVAVKP